jgi:protein ImuB
MSYLLLRAPEFPAQALLSLRPELQTHAVAVVEHEPPLERVCSANRRAFAHGITLGMTRVEAEQIPGISLLRRAPAEERSLRNAMLTLLGRYTPRIEDLSSDTVCCFALDLAGTERLIGTPLEVAQHMQQQLRSVGVRTAICISDHLETAHIVSRTLETQDTTSGSRPVLVPSGQEAASLASLPCSALEPDPELAETLTRWGIRTLGQLAALRPADLVARLGQPGKRLHAFANGTHPHLFRPIEPVFVLQADAAFEEPVELADSLLFILGPMLERLITLASAKALAVLSLSLTLKLERAAQHILAVRPALPSTDRKFLLKLLQLELAAHPPSAGVLGLELTAEPASPSREQHGLFSPQLPDSSRLDVTLARVQSIVGEGNVGSPQLRDTHASEGLTMQPFRIATHAKETHPSRPDAGTMTDARIACRRLRPPWPARVAHHRERPSLVTCEHQRFRVKCAYGPWYASGEWWSREAWAREEWEVVLQAENAPVPMHALLVHDLVAQAWRLEGIYD